MATVRINWTDPNSGANQEDEIRVYRKLTPFTEASLPVALATLAADVVQYDDPTALSGETYHYGVAMVKDGSIALTTSSITIDAAAAVSGYRVTVPSGTVGSNLTDFPIMVDLSDMPSSFWTGVDDDGGNIRAYESDGTTLIPVDVTFIDVEYKQGRLFAKTDITALADSSIVISKLAAATPALAVGDANGRNAVWSDYEFAYVFPEQVNRTGAAYTETWENEPMSRWNKIGFRTLPSNPHQGVATDGTNFWAVDTNELYRMDMAFTLLNFDTDVAASLLAGPGLSIDHLGDPVVVGNRLFTTATNPRSGSANYHRYLVEFNATTLAYVTHTEIGDDTGNTNHLFGATVCYDGTNLILFAYRDGSKFRKYNLSGVFQSEVVLSVDLSDGTQGSTVLPNGNILVSQDNEATGTVKDDTITEIEPDGTVLGVVYQDPHGDINEGLAYDDVTGNLFLLLGDGDLVTLNRTNGLEDWAYHHLSATSEINVPATSDIWTSAASISWLSSGVDIQDSFFGWDAEGAFLYDDGPDEMGTWNATDSWLRDTSFVALEGVPFRAAMGYDSTSGRFITIDGSTTTDIASTKSLPPSGTGLFKLGGDLIQTQMQFLWLRHEFMSADWMEADAENMNNPDTFYAITEVS